MLNFGFFNLSVGCGDSKANTTFSAALLTCFNDGLIVMLLGLTGVRTVGSCWPSTAGLLVVVSFSWFILCTFFSKNSQYKGNGDMD